MKTMPKTRISAREITVRAHGLNLTVLVTVGGQSLLPGTRTALYTVQPDAEQGIRSTGQVSISFRDRGDILDAACDAVERMLKV